MDEDCRATLRTTLKWCVMLPEASYSKCIDNGISAWNACTLRRIQELIQPGKKNVNQKTFMDGS